MTTEQKAKELWCPLHAAVNDGRARGNQGEGEVWAVRGGVMRLELPL